MRIGQQDSSGLAHTSIPTWKPEDRGAETHAGAGNGISSRHELSEVQNTTHTPATMLVSVERDFQNRLSSIALARRFNLF